MNNKISNIILITIVGIQLSLFMPLAQIEAADNREVSMFFLSDKEAEVEADIDTELTEEEQLFVENCPTIVIGYRADKQPLSYTDEDGEFAGITRDILDCISEYSGLEFEYIELPTGIVSGQYLIENNINVTCNVEHNNYNLNLDTMKISQPYLYADKVFVSNSDFEYNSDSEVTVAVCTGSETLAKALAEYYPHYTYVVYDTDEECFFAVKDGDADLSIQNRYVSERLLNKPSFAGMEVVPLQAVSDELALGVMTFGDYANDTNKYLFSDVFISIIDKSIAQITNYEIDSIVIRNVAECVYKSTFRDIFYQYRTVIISTAILVALILALSICIMTMRVRNLHIVEEKNRMLGIAVEQANEANSIKGQFLAQMSHEIRTPMNSIIGMTELARGQDDNPPKTQNYLDKISEASKVLMNLINDILDMSAIERGKIKIASEPFDMKAVLDSIANTYYPQCEKKGIDFELYTTNLVDEIYIGDSFRVSQVLLNLVSNAYKFTDVGGRIRITVSQIRKEKQIAYIRIEVEDTGCGMSEEYQKNLFRAFEQEHATTARKYGGSGLGLAITKNLIDRMHGAISVKSTVGVGTKFSVELPFTCMENVSRPDGDVLRGMNVLVVDDDEKTLEYTAGVLDNMGLGYEICQSGEEAIEHIINRKKDNQLFDACIIDWKMNGMSGTETTREIRKIVGNDTIVLIVSAYDLNEVEEDAKLAGADMFIAKPLFQSALYNTLISAKMKRKDTHVKDKQKSYDFSGHKVLVAEDFELNREVIEDILGLVNIEVDCAENGIEVVRMFETAPAGTYDLIFMDIQMPEMDGYEATKVIRELDNEEAKRIPIFAMTANAFVEDVSAVLSVGMNGHVAKPIDTAALYDLLEQQFNRKK